MGIRFYCPNGHKLNVKEFQAGHQGICPFCGVKMQIPLQSTRGSSKSRTKQAAASGPVAQVAAPGWARPTEAAQQPMVVSPQPVSQPAAGSFGGYPQQVAAPTTGPVAMGPMATGPQPTANTAAGPYGQVVVTPTVYPTYPGGQNVGQSAGPTVAASSPYASQYGQAGAGASAAPPTDALLEGGDCVWYVRPAAGGQFGPASREVMRAWLGEGRVSADSLVWREGWRDWLVAGDVFPQLRAGAAVAPIAAVAVDPGRIIEPLVVTSATPLSTVPRKMSKQTQLLLIGLLFLAVVVLAVVFFLLIR